jgi:hypothetical protein
MFSLIGKTTMLLVEHDEDSMNEAWAPIMLARMEHKLHLSMYPYPEDYSGGMSGITMVRRRDT